MKGGWDESTFFRNSSPILLGVVKIGLHDLFKNLGDCVSVEWWETTEQNICDHSNAPHVYFFSVSACIEHLGGCNNKIRIQSIMINKKAYRRMKGYHRQSASSFVVQQSLRVRNLIYLLKMLLNKQKEENTCNSDFKVVICPL